jgi:hypothetical protein
LGINVDIPLQMHQGDQMSQAYFKEKIYLFADLKSEQNVQKYFDPMSLFEMSLDEIGL